MALEGSLSLNEAWYGYSLAWKFFDLGCALRTGVLLDTGCQLLEQAALGEGKGHAGTSVVQGMSSQGPCSAGLQERRALW